VRRFPAEFEDLLSPRGRKVLRGKDELCGRIARGLTRFVAADDLLDPRLSRGAMRLLDGELLHRMRVMEDAIPASIIEKQKTDYSEKLPKTVRVLTDIYGWEESKAKRQMQAIGLDQMLHSESYHAFAEQLSGHRLKKQWGTQVLCYRKGDYAGPHNDAHPEEPLVRHGYIDMHLSFCTPGVQHQFLVYERLGHFTESVDIHTVGGVTCYRLPVWHYTTPLMVKPGHEKTARRWLVLGTFIDKMAKGKPKLV